MPKVEQFPYVISEAEETRIADTPKQQGNDNVPLHSVTFQQVEVTIERTWTGGSSIGFSFEEDVPMDNGYKLIWNMKSEWNRFLPYDAGAGKQGTASDALTWVEGDKVKVALSRRDYWHKAKQESTAKGVVAFGRKVGGSDAQPSEATSAPVAARPSASSTKTSILKGMGFNNISTVLGAAIINDHDLAMDLMPMWREAAEHAVRGEEVFQADDPELLAWIPEVPEEQDNGIMWAGTLGDMLNDSAAMEIEVPVTGAAAEGSLQKASGQIIQNIFNEDVINLDDVPVTTPSPEPMDYMIASKELLHEEYGADGAAEASQWLEDNVGIPSSFKNDKAYWFAAYLKLTI